MKTLAIPTLQYKSKTRIVFEYIRDCPGATCRDLCADLDLSEGTVRVLLARMSGEHMIHYEGIDENKRRMYFLTPLSKPMRDPKGQGAKQETVTEWPKLTIAQQTPWSALGL